MLNLSDKELDRFSKEAAQDYEPGDVLGERSWERLEVRLDRDLGRVSPNPLRHIRRFPFYYAPAMLVLLGVSYYLIKRSVGPPLKAVKASTAVVQNPSSSQSPTNTEKSTPPSSAATPATSADQAAGSAVGSNARGASAGANGAAGNPAGAGTAAGAGASASAGAGVDAGASASGAKRAGASAGTRGGNAAGAGASADTRAGAKASADAGASAGAGASLGAGDSAGANASGASRSGALAGTRGNRRHREKPGRGEKADNTLAVTAPTNAGRATSGKNIGMAAAANSLAGATSNSAGANGATAQQAPEKELGRTTLQGLRPTKKAPHIGDSALRAFTLKSTAPQLIRKGGAHINRSLEFGVLAAPDFASVNSLAGDRPGSTIGLTVDYQFANHWYIGSGLLLDRKIFAARAQDFHAPPGFYQDNGMHGDVDLIKGSFEMLELPLNLRYDFSVTGSTLFFVSGGVSSYLLTSENNNYYWHPPFQFRTECMSVSSPDKTFLFSALNLSMGVETGLSNSLSLLIAPYVKIPTRGIGIGQVQMSTVGINFALKFAPVISRKRY